MMKTHTYIRMGSDYKPIYCPRNDYDGSVTGHIVFEVEAWFDEHPEERKKLGWIKLIHADREEVEYNKQTQCLVLSAVPVDEYTIRQVYRVLDKSEEMMLLEDMMSALGYGGGSPLSALLNSAGIVEVYEE